MQRLQQIGLAAAVCAVEHGDAGVNGQLKVRIVAELPKGQMGEMHGGSAPFLQKFFG